MSSAQVAAVVVGVIVLAAIGTMAVLLVVVYHKLSLGIDRLAKEMPKAGSNVIAQIEALAALRTELKLDHSLPRTRGWAASPDFLRDLMMHTLARQPRQIVECGSGVSTIVLARCVQLLGEGHVWSLEHDARFAERTREALRRHGLSHRATVYEAPLRELVLPRWTGKWYSQDVLPSALSIDLLVVDGPPWYVGETPRYPALPMLYPVMGKEAVIYLDDAARPEEELIVKRWLEEFPDFRPMAVPKCEKGCVALVRTPLPPSQ
jgi:predicted O-methyltransferase YrrM